MGESGNGPMSGPMRDKGNHHVIGLLGATGNANTKTMVSTGRTGIDPTISYVSTVPHATHMTVAIRGTGNAPTNGPTSMTNPATVIQRSPMDQMNDPCIKP